jgi:hypothetical protein
MHNITDLSDSLPLTRQEIARRKQESIVRAAVEAKSWTYIGPYEGKNKPLKKLCPNGCPSTASWAVFRKKPGCKSCSGLIVKHETVLKAFEDANCILLTEYVGPNTQKLRFICPKNHVWVKTWQCFRESQKCGRCSGKGKTKENLAPLFAEKGLTLVSEYVNDSTPMKYICSGPVQHTHRIRANRIKDLKECSKCACQVKYEWEDVCNIFAKEKWTLTSESYINNQLLLEALCPQKHPVKITLKIFQMKKQQAEAGKAETTGCKQCDNENAFERVKKAMTVRKCILLSTKFERVGKPLIFICPSGIQRSMSWTDFNRGLGFDGPSYKVSERKTRHSLLHPL